MTSRSPDAEAGSMSAPGNDPTSLWEPGLGAVLISDTRTRFRVWAPHAKTVGVHVYGERERIAPLTPAADGYFAGLVDACPAGTLYKYHLDGEKDLPDPVSRYQPNGVHTASAVVDRRFAWTDFAWRGLPLRDYVIYELHPGAFSPTHDFHGVEQRLDDLKDLGITAVELMPVAAFPGNRNWGYDGAYLHAVQASYGGPAGLKALVDACHAHGLAVVLDVVYNHFGPEGNYIARYGPYFTDHYRTPWGSAVNFDGRGSDEVRRFFIENALQWLHDYHIDALRLDAVHAIYDASPVPFLTELATTYHEHAEALGRRAYLIAETDAGDARIVRPRNVGGHGLDAQWNDDFHHALHAVLTEEQTGYYQDFGAIEQLAKAYNEAYVFTGQKSSFRGRTHGSGTEGIPRKRFVVYAQNHDQTGNRMLGDRFGTLLDFEAQKLAAAAVLLSPFLPLIFMGEEYGETAPFQYFISHGDPALVKAVRNGRREEFRSFAWQGEAPDPQSQETFLRSMLQWDLRGQGSHGALREWYKALLRLRREHPAWRSPGNRAVSATVLNTHTIQLFFGKSEGLAAFLHFSPEESNGRLQLPGSWRKTIDSSAKAFRGAGSKLSESVSEGDALQFSPHQSAVYHRVIHSTLEDPS